MGANRQSLYMALAASMQSKPGIANIAKQREQSSEAVQTRKQRRAEAKRLYRRQRNLMNRKGGEA